MNARRALRFHIARVSSLSASSIWNYENNDKSKTLSPLGHTLRIRSIYLNWSIIPMLQLWYRSEVWLILNRICQSVLFFQFELARVSMFTSKHLKKKKKENWNMSSELSTTEHSNIYGLMNESQLYRSTYSFYFGNHSQK